MFILQTTITLKKVLNQPLSIAFAISLLTHTGKQYTLTRLRVWGFWSKSL